MSAAQDPKKQRNAQRVAHMPFFRCEKVASSKRPAGPFAWALGHNNPFSPAGPPGEWLATSFFPKTPAFLIRLLQSSRICPPPTKAATLFALFNWIFKERTQTLAQKTVSVNAGKAPPQSISGLHGPVAAQERGYPRHKF